MVRRQATKRDAGSPELELTRALAREVILREELAAERLRSERAIAYGAHLLARLNAVETLLREYGAHQPGCTGDAPCSCGLRGHLLDVEASRVQMTAL